jgi:hypothetical protein
MDHPAIDSLMETVRRINQISQRARSGDPSVEDYLRSLGSDPVTAWFTDLLREKNDELQKDRERSARVVAALRNWHASGESDADAKLVKTLRDLDIIQQ